MYIFFSFRGFGAILVIVEVLGYFGHYRGFVSIFCHLEVVRFSSMHTSGYGGLIHQ